MYKIFLTRNAEKEYKYLFETNLKLYHIIRAAFGAIALNPHIGKQLKMSLKGKWSYRVGQYRIIYEIESKRLVVYILDIGHRREIYR